MQPSCNAGLPPISVVVAPGAQGAAVAGMQGIGVKAPSAAAVAAATCGLAGLEHMPNAGTFAIGAKSMMVAAGGPLAIAGPPVSAVSAAGAAPKLHVIIAPLTTCIGMPPVLPLTPATVGWKHASRSCGIARFFTSGLIRVHATGLELPEKTEPESHATFAWLRR
jgi:hypothetical protein